MFCKFVGRIIYKYKDGYLSDKYRLVVIMSIVKFRLFGFLGIGSESLDDKLILICIDC